MLPVLLQQLLQLAIQQLLLTYVQLDHPLEVSGAVDVDVVAVEAQLLAGLVGQFDLHLDLDVTAAQHETDLVLLVVAADPILKNSPANATKVEVAPGPNNPVGSFWMGLSKPHWGIHGTPSPSRVGHDETNGCIHMTNWDAQRLSTLAKSGFVVNVKA